jgi:uncharacterized protein (TIGR02118 family)
MIKVSVLYPNTPGARFDHDYYRDRHMPLVQARLGAACLFYTVDRGLCGATLNDAAPFIAQCHIHCESLEAFQTAFGPHAEEIGADIANYTDIEPIVQISDVVVAPR